MAEELTPRQAAERLGATTRSVQRWIARGELPARRVGGRWRVAIDAIDALAEQRPSSDPGRPEAILPIRTLFVANRGEIAARIRRTTDRLGIRVVVPGQDGAPSVDLLDIKAVVSAAHAAGADALHPGFGFLSENADFADAVAGAGIRWVGPPGSAIRAMGDKAAARRLAQALGVPVVPGYDGDDQGDEVLLVAARSIAGGGSAGRRHAVLVKPAAGGGGKGMHVVRSLESADDFLATIAGARREARASFGDDRLILERYLVGPRHVEVQLLFDGFGSGIHLGERDCSLQRRHQKVLEESPSPAVDEPLRGRLGEAALRLASAVGYRSAGTCEFLLDDDGSFYFLEMNTRLQVEHPVTELVTGRDLVADQLRIAAGEPLGVSQAGVDAARRAGGHAVEVRLYAEDAEAGFLPSTGRVEALEWPAGEQVRVDTGIAPGTTVDTRFDPMLAKLIAGGRTRSEALATLAGALDRTLVLGVVDEPAVPALARPPAGRRRRRGPDRHARANLAAHARGRDGARRNGLAGGRPGPAPGHGRRLAPQRPCPDPARLGRRRAHGGDPRRRAGPAADRGRRGRHRLRGRRRSELRVPPCPGSGRRSGRPDRRRSRWWRHERRQLADARFGPRRPRRGRRGRRARPAAGDPRGDEDGARRDRAARRPRGRRSRPGRGPGGPRPGPGRPDRRARTRYRCRRCREETS